MFCSLSNTTRTAITTNENVRVEITRDACIVERDKQSADAVEQLQHSHFRHWLLAAGTPPLTSQASTILPWLDIPSAATLRGIPANILD